MKNLVFDIEFVSETLGTFFVVFLVIILHLYINEPKKVEEQKVKEPKVKEPKVKEPKVEEPKVEEPKVEEPKVEEPKVEEIITVTEIKGVKKIIKNGKVIYCEELKADELKVFEQLKDKKV